MDLENLKIEVDPAPKDIRFLEDRLYDKKLGYEVIGVVEGFPRHPHSEYHLRKALIPAG